MHVAISAPPAPQERASAGVPVTVAFILFFFSGFTSLGFETLFTRLLSYTFGNTAYAASTVLAAFLCGLALGAYVIGRLADRFRPSLLMYGILELLIGFYGLAVPSLFAVLTRIYVFLFHALAPGLIPSTAIRFSLAAIVIVVPSALMGGTLPLLSKTLTSIRSDYHSDLTRLYTVNTFGAAAGALASTYFLMPVWGIRGAVVVAFFVNAGIFLCTAWFARVAHSPETGFATGEETPAVRSQLSTREFDPPNHSSSYAGVSSLRVFLFFAFLTGLITLVYEIVWTHALAFLVGNAVYAFGMMLFTFLCGLAIGAHIVSRLRADDRTWAWAFSLSQLLAGVTVLVTLPLWNMVPRLFEQGVHTARILSLLGICVPLSLRLLWIGITGLRSKWKEGLVHLAIITLLGCLGTLPLRSVAAFFAATEAFRFLIAFYLLIVPVLLVGISFPCLLNLFSRSRAETGKSVGVIYAINTLGSIAGAIVGGFVLLPLLGSYSALTLSATMNAFVGTAFFLLMLKSKPQWRMGFVSVLAGAVLLAVFHPVRWDIKELTRGTYVYFTKGWRSEKVVYAREDVQGGLTTVVQSDTVRTMLSNGKFQGNNADEVQAQIRFGLIPVLFTKKFDRALVIGLGTGSSLRAVAAFPFPRIDVVELAPSVVEASRLFSDVNGDLLDRDPRVHLAIADGRNHLLVSRDRYDLITIEVSSIWIAGEADLYNKQFYELCRSHLGEQGVLQQWVQVHHMRPRDLFVILNTAARVFPHVAFFLGPEQGLLIASSSPLEVDYRQIHALEKEPSVRNELRAANVHSMFSLLGEILLYDQSYRQAVSGFAETNGKSNLESTDEYPYLEYQTPKGNVLPPDLVIDSYFLKRLQTRVLPPDLVIRNVPGPEYLDYIAGLALEDRKDYLGAASAFANIRGPLHACAESEITWTRLMRALVPGSPVPPFSDCQVED